MNEEWKDIEGFSGYQVSSLGRVRTISRYVWNKANGSYSWIKGTIRKLDTKGKKYAQLGIRKDNQYHKFLVHRLVAIAFVPNPLNLPEVNHEDLDKMNNKASNLTWTTRLGNAEHAKQNGRYSNFPRGEKKSNSILTTEAVLHIRRKELRNRDYCKLYNVAPSTVCCLQSDKYQDRWRDAH